MCSSRFRLVALAVVLLGTGACGGADNLDPTAPGADQAVTTTTAPGERPSTVTVTMPFFPPVALPDLSIVGETGDLVAQRLGDFITPVSGVDLVTATCAEEGGDLQYSGSTRADLFDIEHDGSGEYHHESDDGLVSLQIAADGTGEYYDSSSGGLVTIKVAPDGSGEYYSERGSAVVSVEVEPDGSGVYYDDGHNDLLTITLAANGSGQLYHESDEGLLTIDARGDGSGEYFFEGAEGQLLTVRADDTGGWVLNDATTSSRLIELTVEPDGSGRYAETGLNSDELVFDVEGQGQGQSEGREIVLPPAPEFSVAGSFPPLGSLGSLSPPCAAVIRFDSELLFDFNETSLRPETGEVLDQVVAALSEAGQAVEVNGHTDSIGGEEYNLDLSLQRAEAVEEALRARGLTVDVTVNGLGESHPVAPNVDENGEDDPAGRALNRRVEIVIRE